MEVTIIMPVYNAEKWLNHSIESVLGQTSANWRMLCVDDGSTDCSRDIIGSFCKKESRISLLCQSNSGPAVARARAIEQVETEYVAILDSDDAYTSDYVEKMLAKAEETGADTIVPDVEFGYGNTQKLPNMFEQHHIPAELVIENGKEAFAMTFPWKLHGWLMVRTSLAKQYYTVQQASYSKFNSDEYITRLLYLKSKKVALCSAIYKYRIDSSSITRKPSLKMMDYLVTNMKLLWLAEYEQLDRTVILSIYNDYYVTCRDLKMSRIPHLEQSDREKAMQLLTKSCIAFKKDFKWDYLKGAPIKTKIKFLLFLACIRQPIIAELKNFYYAFQKNIRHATIRNREVTIISNNCWGGFMYQSCSLPYNSPFIGLCMYAPEYIALLRNLKANLNQPLHFIKHDDSKYKDIVSPQYIIGVLGDTGIEIVFMHYHFEEEILETWKRRLKRINWDNMIVKFSDTDLCSDDLVEEFDKMPFEHKVCFTAKKYPNCKSVIPMAEYKNDKHVIYEWAYSYRYFNFVKEVNKIIN